MRAYFHPSGEHIVTVEEGFINLVDVYYQVNKGSWYWVSETGVVHGMVVKDIPHAVQMMAILVD